MLVIEKDEHSPRSTFIAEELGDVVLKGDGCEAATLEAAGTGRADMLIAVTGDDEDNLVACQVARARFRVPKTMARINNPKNELIFRKLGIDVTVSATSAILNQIEQELPTHRLVPLLHLRGRAGLEMVEVRIPAGSRIIGKEASDVLLPQGAMITLIVDADGNPHLPAGYSVHAEDVVIAVSRVDAEEQLRRALTER